jgi:hypothetical protein
LGGLSHSHDVEKIEQNDDDERDSVEGHPMGGKGLAELALVNAENFQTT